jgi:hypothetical protein
MHSARLALDAAKQWITHLRLSVRLTLRKLSGSTLLIDQFPPVEPAPSLIDVKAATGPRRRTLLTKR